MSCSIAAAFLDWFSSLHLLLICHFTCVWSVATTCTSRPLYWAWCTKRSICWSRINSRSYRSHSIECFGKDKGGSPTHVVIKRWGNVQKGSCDIGIVGKSSKPNCLFALTDILSRLADDDQGSRCSWTCFGALVQPWKPQGSCRVIILQAWE